MEASSQSEIDAAVEAERARCLKILEDEIKRGRSLLGLLDMSGQPVFDDQVTMSCLEAIEYCAKLIRDGYA